MRSYRSITDGKIPSQRRELGLLLNRFKGSEGFLTKGDMEELFVTERSTAKGGQRMEVKDDISGLETRIDRFAMGMVFGFVALGGLVLVKAGRGHAPQR